MRQKEQFTKLMFGALQDNDYEGFETCVINEANVNAVDQLEDEVERIAHRFAIASLYSMSMEIAVSEDELNRIATSRLLRASDIKGYCQIRMNKAVA